MQPNAGWYADPTGSSDLRYWDGTQWTEHTSGRKQPVKVGLWIALAGIIVAFSPILFAFIVALTSRGSMWSESGEGAGAALWLLFFSVPAGGIVIVVGLVVGLTEKVKTRPRR